MNLSFKPLSEGDARAVISWRYEGPYDMYDIQTEDINAEVAHLIDPENHYYGIYNGEELIGHAVFHVEARVPGGDYSADAVDVGAGMRPDITGRGKGADIIGQILDFARSQYHPSAFRATIAAWNERAQKATTRNGFYEISRFVKADTDQTFIIFMRKA